MRAAQNHSLVYVLYVLTVLLLTVDQTQSNNITCCYYTQLFVTGSKIT